MKPDWEAIKAEYIRGGISQQKLADKRGVHRRHMVKEGWQQLRNEAEEKLIEIVPETQTETIYDKLLDSIAKYPAGAGTKITRETVNSVTMDDGSEKKYPLKSAIVTELESIARGI